MSTTVPDLLRAGFYTTSAGILALNAIPAIRRRFVVYAKTVSTDPKTPSESKSAIASFLDKLATFTVPHSYFDHFYIVGVGSSLFWGYQIATHGWAYRQIAARAGNRGGGMGIEQVVIVWVCFTAQVLRRLYECHFVQKKGGSRMSPAHYLLGMVFYSAMSVAMWIEGIAAIDAFKFNYWSLRGLLNAPSLRTFVNMVMFLMASGAQHDAHGYLASLKKYSLPQHPLFQRLICPHYTAECIIYTALAIMTAPKGSALNRTILAGLAFVVTNLGITAKLNREWYEGKFGKEVVKGRWNMIPGLF